MRKQKHGDASALQWKIPYEAAILERDPTKLQLRITKAHEAILDRVDELLTRPSDSEQQALDDALRILCILQEMSNVGNDTLLH